MIRRIAPSVLALLLAVVGLPGAAMDPPAAGAAGPNYIPLQLWWSPSRADYFTTSDPAWYPRSGVNPPDYTFVATLGLVFAPTDPAPPDTVPLYSWYSAERGDNFLTDDPGWAGQPGTVREGYTFVRLEGYAFRRSYMGTVPLYHWFSDGRGDNITTSQSRWAGWAGATHAPDYRFVRTAGYILRDGPERSQEDDIAFGLGRMGAAGRPNVGKRPLLTIKIDFSDMKFRPLHSLAYYSQLLFGPNGKNVAEYFRETSNGQFTFTNAGMIGTFHAPNDSKTVHVDESTRACAVPSPQPCPGGPRSESKLAFKALAWAAQQHHIDFGQWDVDHNGEVTDAELAVLIVWPFRPIANGGVNRPIEPWCGKPPGISVRLCLDIGFFDEGAGLATIAHELSHSFGTLDIYGSDGNSHGLSLMGGWTLDGEEHREVAHLDPWHEMALSWARPRIYDLRSPGDCIAMDAQSLPSRTPSLATPHDPILFYDSAHGRAEYFMADFRRPTGTGLSNYDDVNRVPSVALWQIKVDANLVPLLIPGLKIRPGKNGVFERPPAGDDVYSRDSMGITIVSGPDRVLQTGVDYDDVLLQDRLDVLYGPPNGRRGVGTWTAADGPAMLRWYGGADSGHSVLVGAIGTASPRTYVEWDPGRTPPRLDTVSAGIVTGQDRVMGRELTVTGSLGVRRDAYPLKLVNRAGTEFTLQTTGWSCGKATATIPMEVSPGSYGLFADDASARDRSNELFVEIP